MESAIIKNLKPEFEPVAVVWSDTIPDDACQFKKRQVRMRSLSLC
jgi:hypothetical protein